MRCDIFVNNFNMIDMTTIGKRLAKAREFRNYKHAKDFANAHGLTYGTYLAHETGDRNARLTTLQDYARMLNINVHWLVHGTGSMLEPGDLEYSQSKDEGGLTGAPYTGSHYAVKKKSLTQEVSDFLALYSSLSPAAKSTIHSLLRDEILSGMDSDEAVLAIKSRTGEKDVSDRPEPAPRKQK